MTDLSTVNFDTMTAAEFENWLPELFAQGGKVSTDPRFTRFLAANPICAELVSDLETIADTARSLFEPEHEVDPSDSVWEKIAGKLKVEPAAE